MQASSGSKYRSVSVSKYRNVKVQVNGLIFDSKKEAERWVELVEKLRRGEIANLVRQVKFPIDVNGERVCTYTADFGYDTRDGRVIEDVKGIRTPVYRLKKKLMRIVNGVDIQEI